MRRFTSGFCFQEDGSKLFLVNTKYYYLKDDAACFRMSSAFHSMQNITIENSYEIMRADIKYVHDNSWDVQIDFNDNGQEELRVYKVIERDV